MAKIGKKSYVFYIIVALVVMSISLSIYLSSTTSKEMLMTPVPRNSLNIELGKEHNPGTQLLLLGSRSITESTINLVNNTMLNYLHLTPTYNTYGYRLTLSDVIKAYSTSINYVTGSNVQWYSEENRELFNNVPLSINIVFLGVPRNLVDVDALKSLLDPWYALIHRGKHVLLQDHPIIVYINYTINYKFYFLDNLANEYAKFLVQNAKVDIAPPILQDNGIEKALYIDADLAEEWLLNHIPSEILNSGYTIIIISTVHTTPSIKEYYYYRAKSANSDTGSITILNSQNQFMVAYGGKYPFLFLDLSAGPAFYQDTAKLFIPIWAYDFNKPEHRDTFHKLLAFYINAAIEMRFIQSWLYSPEYRPDYEVKVIYYVNSSFPYTKYFNFKKLLGEYARLHKYSSFIGSIEVRTLDDDPELKEFLLKNRDPRYYNRVPLEKVLNYFYTHADKYLKFDSEAYVLPIYIFTDMCIAYEGGISVHNPETGDAYFVFCHYTPTIDVPVLIPVDIMLSKKDDPRCLLNPGQAKVVFNGTVFASGSLRLKVIVEYGVIDVYILDAYNFYKLVHGASDWKPVLYKRLYSPDMGGKKEYDLEVKAPSTMPLKYYVIYYNPSSWDYAIHSSLVLFLMPPWVGQTYLLLHEAGHSFCMAHPHDGFSWRLYFANIPRDLPGEYTFWLWDMSHAVMTYLIPNMVFDYFETASLYRGMTVITSVRALKVAKYVSFLLNRYGFEIIPPHVKGNLTLTTSMLSKALEYFRQPLPDYDSSFKYSIQSLIHSILALRAFRESLLNVTFKIVDFNDKPLANAKISLSFPNGTIINLTTDSEGYVKVTGAPWGTYRLNVTWSGVTVAKNLKFNKTSSEIDVVKTKVYSLEMILYDSRGLPVTENVTLMVILPNGTQTSINSNIIEQVPQGTVKVLKILWRGLDVTPAKEQVINVESNVKWKVNVRIYYLDITFTDSLGRTLPINPERIELRDPLGRMVEYVIGEPLRVAPGGYELASIIWQGSPVTPLSGKEIIVTDSDVKVEVSCSIAPLTIEFTDYEGEVRIGNVMAKIRAPNGTVIDVVSEDTSYRIEYAQEGTWTIVEATWGGIDVTPSETTLEFTGTEEATWPLNLKIYKLTFKFHDSKGRELETPPSSMGVILPNGTKTNIRTYTIYVQQGKITLTNVIWMDVNVAPEKTISLRVSKPLEIEVPCRVYSITITALDSMEKPLAKAEVVVTYPNGDEKVYETNEDGKITIDQLPIGDYTITVKWHKVNVREEELTITKDSKLSLECKVYYLTFTFIDYNEEPLEGINVKIIDPTGNELELKADENGKASLKQIPMGTYTVEAYWKKVKVLSKEVEVSDNERLEMKCKVYNLVVKVKDSLGFAVDGASVRLYTEEGRLFEETETRNGGYAEFKQIPVGNYVVEASAIGSSSESIMLNKGMERTITVPLSITSLMIIAAAIIAIPVGIIVLKKRRKRVAKEVEIMVPPPPPA